MNKKITTQQIVGTGLLLALTIIFQIIGNYLQFGPVNINLTLVIVVLGAMLYGPISGAILGFFNGIMALFSPSTLAVFMPISLPGTIIACLSKCTLAGLIVGFIFKLFKDKNRTLGAAICGVSVPIINTGIFAVCSLIFFRPFLESGVSETFPNIGAFLIFGVIGWNFIFEIITTVILSIALSFVVFKRRHAK